MPNVLIFVDPDPDGVAPFRIIDRKFAFDRIPCIGEIISLGNDEDGIAADYEVVLVHHAPLQPKDIDAEVYGHRVFLPDVIKAATKPLRSGIWKPKSRPAIVEGDIE